MLYQLEMQKQGQAVFNCNGGAKYLVSCFLAHSMEVFNLKEADISFLANKCKSSCNFIFNLNIFLQVVDPEVMKYKTYHNVREGMYSYEAAMRGVTSHVQNRETCYNLQQLRKSVKPTFEVET